MTRGKRIFSVMGLGMGLCLLGVGLGNGAHVLSWPTSGAIDSLAAEREEGAIMLLAEWLVGMGTMGLGIGGLVWCLKGNGE